MLIHIQTIETPNNLSVPNTHSHYTIEDGLLTYEDELWLIHMFFTRIKVQVTSLKKLKY